MVDNKNYLEALNVLLPNYFEKVQHYLDCAAYDMEYNFPFLYQKEQKFAEVAEKCFNDFDEEATTLSPECTNVCQKLNVANFSPVFESNHTFIVKAVNYFETLAHSANERNEQREKNQFNEMAKITQENKQTVQNVGATDKAKVSEKERLLREERERLAEIERKRKEEEERKRRAAAAAAAARRRAAAAAAAIKKPWWKFWRKLTDKKSKNQLKRLVRGKSKKSSIKIAKNFVKKITRKRRKLKLKQKKLKKLSRKLMMKHFPKHKLRRNRRRHKRHLRILEAGAKKPEEKGVPKPPPAGAPKDPEHEALLKLQKEIYDQIEFMFDKEAAGVVKTADLPLDIDLFDKTFLYGQGINIYLYASMINTETSRNEFLAKIMGKKLGDAMENRIEQVLEAIDEAFKTSFNTAMDASYIFGLGAKDTHSSEAEYEKAKEHLLPIECFFVGCQDNVPKPGQGDAVKEEKAPAEGEKKADEKKPEEKKPEEKKSAQTRVLEMDRGFNELEGLFDLREGSKNSQILF